MSHTMIMLIAALALLVLLRLSIRDAARATRLFLVLWLVVGRQSALRRAFGRLWLGRGGDGVAARLRRPRGFRADHEAVQGAGLIRQPLAPA